MPNRNVHSRRSSVYVYGYFNLNIGDDLFLKILFERYPDTMFYVPIQDKDGYSELFSKYQNAVLIHPSTTYKILRKSVGILFPSLYQKFKFKVDLISAKVNKFDNFISIGGSIFGEKNNNQKDYRPDFYNVTEKINNRFFLGSNFGPFKTREFLSYYENLFSKATDVCFRDKESFELFNHLQNVRMAPDIVFSLNTLPVKGIAALNKTVGFSIVDPDRKFQSKECDRMSYIKNIHL